MRITTANSTLGVVLFEIGNEIMAGLYPDWGSYHPPRALAFTWRPDRHPDAGETVVRWELAEDSGVTTVRLTHSGFSTPESRSTYRGWPAVIGGLRRFVEEAR